MSDSTRSGVVQTVRRKLAALFGSVRIGEIAPSELCPAAVYVEVQPASTGDVIRSGTAVGILSTALFPADASENLCKAPVAQTSDAVAELTAVEVHDGLPGPLVGASEQMLLDAANRPDVYLAELMPPDVARVHEPAQSKIEPAPVHVADVNRPRPLTKADRRALPVHFKATRVGYVPQYLAAELTLERRREPMVVLDRNSPPIGFEREMALLKAASGEPDADIKLVGVYCSVPIGAASRLEFDPSKGSLMLNIRENAFESIASAKRPVVTLVLGQIVSTGRMVRAFRPDPT